MKQLIVCFFYMLFLFNSGETQNLPTSTLQDMFNIVKGLPIVGNVLDNPSVTSDNVMYYLFNSTSPQTYTIIDASNASVLNRDAPIVFLFHGWSQNRTIEWYELLKNAFFEYDSQCLVVEVDWGTYANLNYFNAKNATKPVGDVVGTYIATLHTNYSIPLKNILLVGHSLGGHVAGFAGKQFYKLLHKKLERIIALDPAGPLYIGQPAANRLHKTDAKVVHVIHTNGGKFGYYLVCGTIDFYPNGGTLQPGCLHAFIRNITQISNNVYCDHHRSCQYFIEAVKGATRNFVSKRCWFNVFFDYLPFLCSGKTKDEEMGNIKTNKTGIYYLDTNSNSPFSIK